MLRKTLLLVWATLVAACAASSSTSSFTPDEDDGWATVRCIAKADGSVSDCQVLEESQAGLGLGEAAVQVVSKGRLSPRTVAGMAPDASIDVTVRFAMQNGRLVARAGD